MGILINICKLRGEILMAPGYDVFTTKYNFRKSGSSNKVLDVKLGPGMTTTLIEPELISVVEVPTLPVVEEPKTPSPPKQDKQVTPSTAALSIIVNGEKLPVSAMNKASRVLVPLRAIFEALDAKVNYDDPTKVITSKKDGRVITLTVNKKEAFVNDNLVLLDVPAQIVNSSTFVPVRFIAESLGAKVDWENNTVFVNLD